MQHLKIATSCAWQTSGPFCEGLREELGCTSCCISYKLTVKNFWSAWWTKTSLVFPNVDQLCIQIWIYITVLLASVYKNSKTGYFSQACVFHTRYICPWPAKEEEVCMCVKSDSLQVKPTHVWGCVCVCAHTHVHSQAGVVVVLASFIRQEKHFSMN